MKVAKFHFIGSILIGAKLLFPIKRQHFHQEVFELNSEPHPTQLQILLLVQ